MFWMNFAMREKYPQTTKADTKRSKENGRRKKDDRYYDDRREEYGAGHGKKKKDKLKDKNRDKAKEKSRGRNRDRDFREEDSYKEEYLEGIQAEGTFIGHPKGFGFVEIEGQEEDIFIPESDTGTAMHQDKVRIIIRDGQKEGKRKEGVVVKFWNVACRKSQVLTS